MSKRFRAATWIGMRDPDMHRANTRQGSPVTKLVIAHLGPIGLAIAVADNAHTTEANA